MDFSNYKFRCSSLGHLMTEPRTKEAKEKGELSESAKTHLIDCYVSAVYNRRSDTSNKYIEKGLAVEESGITLVSRIKKSFFKKNTERISNDYIIGEPDLYTGLEVRDADEIRDIKSSWDIHTFFRTLTKPIDPLYYWQGNGYMSLSGASLFFLDYCLINTPEPIIEAELKRLWYKMGEPALSSDIWIEAEKDMRREMIFDDIPMNERLIEYSVKRDQSEIDKIKDKVIKGREWLNAFHQSRFASGVIASYDAQLKSTIIQSI